MTRRTAYASLLLALGACSDGELITLGRTPSDDLTFGPPTMVGELASAGNVTDPTLTDDLLELYFTGDAMDARGDVWVARRDTRDTAFSAPQRIGEVSSLAPESNPAISQDGLTLWFGSERAGGLGAMDIWEARRATRSARWSAPVLLRELNSTWNDVPRPPGQGGRVMPLSSDRFSPSLYQIFLAERSGPSSPFGAPKQLAELAFADMGSVDGLLTQDGQTLLFSSWTPPDQSDLHLARRMSRMLPFDAPQALPVVNSEHDDRDPWLSPDKAELYFASNRQGRFAIYVAVVRRERPEL